MSYDLIGYRERPGESADELAVLEEMPAGDPTPKRRWPFGQRKKDN